MSSLYVLYDNPELNLRSRRPASFAGVKRVVAELKAWNERRIARAELLAMPDYLLADMGIDRGNIDAVIDGLRRG